MAFKLDHLKPFELFPFRLDAEVVFSPVEEVPYKVSSLVIPQVGSRFLRPAVGPEDLPGTSLGSNNFETIATSGIC